MARLRSILVTSRPRFWLYLAGPVLVGFVFGAESPTELASPLVIGTLLYFLVPANIYLYGFNDIFDAEIDRLNPKKAGRERRFEGDRTVIATVVASLLLGGLVVALSPTAASPWYALFLLLGAAYSVPPVRFKTRPPLDSLSNGLYIVPGVGAYAALSGDLPPLAIIAGAWFWTMAMHTYSAIPDIQPDRRAGIETLATALGRERTLLYCGAVWALAAASFGVVDLRAGGLLSVYPLSVVAVWGTDVPVDRAYWWYPLVNALVGMTFTVYGLVVVFHG